MEQLVFAPRIHGRELIFNSILPDGAGLSALEIASTQCGSVLQQQNFLCHPYRLRHCL